MNEYPELLKALAAMREEDGDKQPSAEVEAKLIAAFRKQHRRSRVWIPISIAACLALMIGAAVMYRPAAVPVAVQPPPPPKAQTPLLQPQVVAQAKPKVKRPARKPTSQVQTAQKPQEFMPLPYSPPFTAYDEGQVVRVSVPRSTVRGWGIPVNENRMLERMQADVFMGGDGVARAVRIVNSR